MLSSDTNTLYLCICDTLSARFHPCDSPGQPSFCLIILLLVLQQLFFLISMVRYAVYRRRQWHPTPVLLPGKAHGRRSLVGCSPWGRYESDMTEQLHFHFSLSCIGEGNGNPLQCSCLENPRDRGAWWAAVSGVAQSRTRLKRLSTLSIPGPIVCQELLFKRFIIFHMTWLCGRT